MPGVVEAHHGVATDRPWLHQIWLWPDPVA